MQPKIDKLRLPATLLAALAATIPLASGASIVHIQVQQRGGTEFGAGYTVGRDADCFVVTPYHVVRFASAGGIRVTDPQGRSAQAKLVKSSEELDAALLQLTEAAPFDCPADWSDGSTAVASIGAAPFLIARKIDGNGRVLQTRLFPSSTSRELVELAPFGQTDEIREGDSGSTLYAGDEIVGMVVSVNTESRQATALTQSQIHGLFGADVLAAERRTAVVQPFRYRNAENAYATVAAREYLTATAGFELAAGAAAASVDYVFAGTIVDISTTRIANPHYQPPERNTGQQSVGRQLVRSLERRFEEEVADVLDRNTDARFLRVYTVDVQVEVRSAGAASPVVSLERRTFELPETAGTPIPDLEKTAVASAVKEALALTFEKYLN